METRSSLPSAAQRLLAFVLGRSRPNAAKPIKAKVYVPKLVTAYVPEDATRLLRQQLAINISQKARAQYTGGFELKQLQEFRDLLPTVEGFVLMSDAQRHLLREYVEGFWKLAKESGNGEQAKAYDDLLDELHFATSKPAYA